MRTASSTEITVERTVRVPLGPDQAFALFTERMSEWWPREHSIGTSAIAEVVVEPRTGGRWFERGTDGNECQWGRVARWEPPGELVLLWQIGANWAFDPELETEVEISFNADTTGGTRVELRHRHLERYGDQADAMRGVFGSPGGWTGTLARFAELAC